MNDNSARTTAAPRIADLAESVNAIFNGESLSREHTEHRLRLSTRNIVPRRDHDPRIESVLCV